MPRTSEEEEEADDADHLGPGRRLEATAHPDKASTAQGVHGHHHYDDDASVLGGGGTCNSGTKDVIKQLVWSAV